MEYAEITYTSARETTRQRTGFFIVVPKIEDTLELLKTLFIKNNYRSCYVGLTQTDIRLPVAKAIIPGMRLLGDFYDYSRVHPEWHNNYLSLFKTDT